MPAASTWRAGTHPGTAVGALDASRRERIHEVMQTVLDRSVRAGQVPSGGDWLNGQRGVEDPTCPRCGAALERGRVAGRSTYWCPAEQSGC